MKRIILFLFGVFLFATVVSAQKYYSRTGYVKFFSEAPLENIEAENNQATCILDLGTGEVVSKILMEAFEFKKALMQEHFNENYVESDKYPLAVFKAKIKNINEIDIRSKTPQSVKLQGDLTIHNITHSVTIDGKLLKTENGFMATANFSIKPADYDIKIPAAVKDHIAKEVEVSLDFNLEEFKK